MTLNPCLTWEVHSLHALALSLLILNHASMSFSNWEQIHINKLSSVREREGGRECYHNGLLLSVGFVCLRCCSWACHFDHLNKVYFKRRILLSVKQMCVLGGPGLGAAMRSEHYLPPFLGLSEV